MKIKKSLIYLSIIFCLIIATNKVEAKEPIVSATAAVLMDATTGTVLYERNAYRRMPPASTTKILTAIIAIEKGNPKDIVTVSRKASQTRGSSIYLKKDDKITLEELLYGALLESGNDACVAIAEHIAGSEEKFVQMMNEKALEIGTKGSTFKNPNGLPKMGHYSTAYDLALIARYALKNPKFAEIVSTKERAISWYGQAWNKYLRNTNRLLWEFEGTNGVKTGTTSEAGQCLVSSATRKDQQLIAVVLRSGDRWGESSRLLSYGFKNFSLIRIAPKHSHIRTIFTRYGKPKRIELTTPDEIALVVPIDNKPKINYIVKAPSYLEAPIRKGQKIGTLQVYVDGKLTINSRLIAEKNVDRKTAIEIAWEISIQTLINIYHSKFMPLIFLASLAIVITIFVKKRTANV